jgi:hypothetical protein
MINEIITIQPEAKTTQKGPDETKAEQVDISSKLLTIKFL